MITDKVISCGSIFAKGNELYSILTPYEISSDITFTKGEDTKGKISIYTTWLMVLIPI